MSNEQDMIPGIPSEEGLVLAKVIEKQDEYMTGFYYWLKDNFGIWKRFVQEADKIVATGRSHYSARTIGEFIRHQTSLREGAEFKINNDVFPSCARLYMAIRPECAGFFETRRRA